MAKFLSEQWIKAYQERWNNDREIRHGLRNIDTTMKYWVQGEESGAVFIRLKRGKAVEAGRAVNGRYDYEMWATEADWKRIASGELGPKRAMAMQKLKFKGSMVTAMLHIGPFGRSLNMMSEVETEW